MTDGVVLSVCVGKCSTYYSIEMVLFIVVPMPRGSDLSLILFYPCLGPSRQETLTVEVVRG